ncbi:MAG TPA: hypothetical protein VHE81_18855 [Lacipirellulaceae bacterium]|nr:hypothetical protein [Lacipirellulaceae bacterium]
MLIVAGAFVVDHQVERQRLSLRPGTVADLASAFLCDRRLDRGGIHVEELALHMRAQHAALATRLSTNNSLKRV